MTDIIKIFEWPGRILRFLRALTLKEQAIWTAGFILGLFFGLQGWLISIIASVLLFALYLLIRAGQDIRYLTERNKAVEEFSDG